MKPNRIYYRSLIDGKLWCESSNPQEVLNKSHKFNCKYEKIEYYEMTTGWEDWDTND